MAKEMENKRQEGKNRKRETKQGRMTKCHDSRNLHIAAKIGHYPSFFPPLLFMKVAHYPRDVKPLLHSQSRGVLSPFLSNLPHSSGKSRGKID